MPMLLSENKECLQLAKQQTLKYSKALVFKNTVQKFKLQFSFWITKSKNLTYLLIFWTQFQVYQL